MANKAFLDWRIIMLMRKNDIASRPKIDKSWLEIDKKSGLVK